MSILTNIKLGNIVLYTQLLHKRLVWPGLRPRKSAIQQTPDIQLIYNPKLVKICRLHGPLQMVSENRVNSGKRSKLDAKGMSGHPADQLQRQFRVYRRNSVNLFDKSGIAGGEREQAAIRERVVNGDAKRDEKKRRGRKRRERNGRWEGAGEVSNKLPRGTSQFVCRTRPFVDTILLSSTKMRGVRLSALGPQISTAALDYDY